MSNEQLAELTQPQRDRLAFVELRVRFIGEIRRQDLVTRFGIQSAAQAHQAGALAGRVHAQQLGRDLALLHVHAHGVQAAAQNYFGKDVADPVAARAREFRQHDERRPAGTAQRPFVIEPGRGADHPRCKARYGAPLADKRIHELPTPFFLFFSTMDAAELSTPILPQIAYHNQKFDTETISN